MGRDTRYRDHHKGQWWAGHGKSPLPRAYARERRRAGTRATCRRRATHGHRWCGRLCASCTWAAVRARAHAHTRTATAVRWRWPHARNGDGGCGCGGGDGDDDTTTTMAETATATAA